jgi:hypothetical protein
VGDPQAIVIDLREAKRRMSSIIRMGFAEDSEERETTTGDLSLISAPIQSVYRAWDIRARELERARPYFGRDSNLRDKISPFEVVRSGRERDPEPPRPSRPAEEKPTLSLRRGRDRR